MPLDHIDKERELLLRVAEGDETAFARLFALFRNDVYMHALTYSKSPEFSEELVLDIFLKLWTNRRQLPAVQHLKSYLFILSRNHIISAMRKRLSEEKTMTMPEDLKEELMSPSTQLEAKDVEHLLKKIIDDLPPQQKMAFTLSRIENKTYDEIAAIMGITRRTVNFHIVQALNTLRIFLRSNILLLLLPVCL